MDRFNYVSHVDPGPSEKTLITAGLRSDSSTARFARVNMQASGPFSTFGDVRPSPPAMPEHSSNPREDLKAHRQPRPDPRGPRHPLTHFLPLWLCLTSTSHMERTTQCVAFCVWLLPLSQHEACEVRSRVSPLHSPYGGIIFHCTEYVSRIHSSADGRLNSPDLSATMLL